MSEIELTEEQLAAALLINNRRIARAGGLKTSNRKREASAANGKKGGRPAGSKNKPKPLIEVLDLSEDTGPLPCLAVTWAQGEMATDFPDEV